MFNYELSIEILRRFAPQNDFLLSERTVGDACPYKVILNEVKNLKSEFATRPFVYTQGDNSNVILSGAKNLQLRITHYEL